MKKIISFAVALIMLLSSFVISTFAEEQEIVDLMDTMSVIDSGISISNKSSQSVHKGAGGIEFYGPGAAGGNGYPRALCKIDGDNGVNLTGYTYMYADIEFNSVTPTDLFRTGFMLGNTEALTNCYIVSITDELGNEVTPSATSEADGVTKIDGYNTPNDLGASFTLTFKVKINSTLADTTPNRFFCYPSGWNGITAGTLKLTSIRLGGDTDPGTEMSARFISVLRDADLSKYTEVGFEVTAALGETSNTQVASGNTVYTSVIGAGNEYTPDLFGGNYFAALRIDNIPATEGLTFTVRSYVKTIEGEFIYSDAVTYTVTASGTIS